jgi:hypothetical protein
MGSFGRAPKTQGEPAPDHDRAIEVYQLPVVKIRLEIAQLSKAASTVG